MTTTIILPGCIRGLPNQYLRLLLRPRKFTHKNIHKRRFFRFTRKSNLNFGRTGLLLLQPLRLGAKQMTRYKLFIKKSSKRSDKTLRKSWFNFFPHIPVSRKIEGSRMGKGKGKLAFWATEVPAGLYIVEVKGLRYGRSVYFLNQIRHRLPAFSRIVSKSALRVKLPLDPSKEVFFDVVW